MPYQPFAAVVAKVNEKAEVRGLWSFYRLIDFGAT